MYGAAMHMVRATCTLAGILACGSAAQALEIEHSKASFADKQYCYELVALLDAPADRVEAVLRDYEGYPQLDRRILESRVLERPSDYTAILESTVRVCFGPFCNDVHRVERVEQQPLGLKAVAEPARSDVKFGETTVFLSVVEGRTRVSYRATLVPDFWIPPIPGKRWMLRTLEDATIDLFRGIEKKAREE